MAAHAIHLSNSRARLTPRREPYWGSPLERGLFLGVRRLTDGETWVARLHDDDKNHRYQSLGFITQAMDYQTACTAARDWAANQRAGVDRKIAETVADACRAYVEDRRSVKGEDTARDAQRRFERTVYSKPIGKIALDRLRQGRIETWRDGLTAAGLSKASANRNLIALKAALNYAIAKRFVGAGQAIEWKSVKAYVNAGKRRDLFLDLNQRRAMRAAAVGAVGDLIEAAMLTGARAGELVSATRSQFESRTGSLRLHGKTGTRIVPLAPAAVETFKRLAKGKLPGAYLLTRDDGKRWAHSDWDELVRDTGAAAKLPAGVCLYTLRHSWITAAITGGMTPLEVARLAGTSLTMIDKHYGHLAITAARERLATVEFG